MDDWADRPAECHRARGEHEAAAAARFCPGCDGVLLSARCESCGAVHAVGAAFVPLDPRLPPRWIETAALGAGVWVGSGEGARRITPTRWLLLVIAAGLAAYGIYNLVRARYRVIRAD